MNYFIGFLRRLKAIVNVKLPSRVHGTKKMFNIFFSLLFISLWLCDFLLLLLCTTDYFHILCQNSLASQLPWVDPKVSIFLKIIFILLFIFRERGREGEREGNVNVWLPLTRPLLGTWPETQACALTENWTSDPLLHRQALNPLSHTSQGWIFLKKM